MLHACFVINDYNFLITHRLDLLKNLAKQINVTVICDIKKNDENKIKDLDEFNIKIIKIRRRNGIFDFLRYRKDLISKLNNNFTHVFFVTLEQSFFGALIAKKPCAWKLYFIISGLGHNFFKLDFKSLLIKNLQKYYFKSAFKKNLINGIIYQNCEDKALFADFYKEYPQKEYLIKGNGINLIDFPYIQRNFKNLNFCYTGRLVHSKGIEKLLDAHALIVEKYPERKIKLIICGIYDLNDDDKISISTLQRLRNSEDISFYENLEHSKVIKVLERASIFVLPSAREGISKAALEAASTGMPIVAANTDGTKDVVQHNTNGLIYEYRNKNGLLNSLEHIINLREEELEAFSRASREFIKSDFSSEIITQKYLEIIL